MASRWPATLRLWTTDHRLLLDGPRATPAEIERALHTVNAGNLFGYRFQYPPMRVGLHEVYWHRPLVAFQDVRSGQAPGSARCSTRLPDRLRPGCTRSEKTDRALAAPVTARAASDGCVDLSTGFMARSPTTPVSTSASSWIAVHLLGDAPLPHSFARHLLDTARNADARQLAGSAADARSSNSEAGQRLVERPARRHRAWPRTRPARAADLSTARRRRDFEVKYWKTIAALAEGKYLNKEQRRLRARRADAEALACITTAISMRWATTVLELLSQSRRSGGHDREGAGRRSAVLVADRFRLSLDGRLAATISKAHVEERDLIVVHSRPRSKPSRHHGRPLRHGLHGATTTTRLWRRRRPARRGRRRRQSLGHRDAACWRHQSSWN